MDVVGTGLVLIANGALEIAHQFTSLTTIVVLVAAASLGWLATMEVEELNRQGMKPDVARH